LFDMGPSNELNFLHGSVSLDNDGSIIALYEYFSNLRCTTGQRMSRQNKFSDADLFDFLQDVVLVINKKIF
jgi:hypothetical protein